MNRGRILLLLLGWAGCVSNAASGPVSADGQELTVRLEAMHVEEHWLAGAIVDWRTGDPTGKPATDDGRHTHCSQFAAAACDRLGVYLLHPPEHGSKLLANAQFDWLAGESGRKRRWSAVRDGIAAQELSNRGFIVVAVYQNPDPKKSGHVAIVHPSTKGEAEIKAEGPQIIQAGGTNYTSASLKQGFRRHPGAFENGEIKFYSHAVKFESVR